MKRAVISDIHSNLEALNAVLEDIQEQGADEIFCLGDVIGYGASPIECLDLVMSKCKVCLLGNHDQGALFDPEGFNGSAERAIFWTREVLERPSARRDARWDFINERPRVFHDTVYGMMFVHGSPRNPLNEYIFPEDIYNHRKLEALFSLVAKYCFMGHTHFPGVFTESGKFFRPDEFNGERVLNGSGKLMINVGSVGQPRDGNPDACYVLLDIDEDRISLRYRRVKYDVQRSADKIFRVPGLDNALGERLFEGH